jgi:HlyD family secretion protein
VRLLSRYRWLLLLLVVAAIATVALWPEPVPVDVAPSVRGPLVVTIDEEGETRVRHRFVVSAPVAGRVSRIELEPGDQVEAGRTVVARIRPEPPALLDARSRAEAEAAVATARAELRRAQAELGRATAASELAQADLRRERELDSARLTTAQALDAAEAAAETAREGVAAAEFAVAAARSEVSRAEARLIAAAPASSGREVAVTAPTDGVVLDRLRESESAVAAGEPLVEIGDPDADLEIVADLLSTDAVRVPVGAEVRVERWGGSRPLAARVRRVEPSGFTKVSALGVEEQRVNVVMELEGPADAWTELGDGYRVEVRIVVWEAPDVVKVPVSSLVRRGEGWAVFALDDGRIHERAVEIGQRNDDEAEIRSGIDAGALVVVHPGDRVSDGVAARARGDT